MSTSAPENMNKNVTAASHNNTKLGTTQIFINRITDELSYTHLNGIFTAVKMNELLLPHVTD